MSKAKDKLLAAKQQADTSQSRFMDTLDTAKTEFHPAAITGTAVANVKQGARTLATKSTRAITSRPGTLIALGTAVSLFVFRKPIARAVRTQLDKIKARQELDKITPPDTPENSGPQPDPTPKSTMTEEV
jgi:hypothetical protein